MSKKKMFINIVLDESSSMQASQAETISGFNEYIDGQKNIEEVDILVSLTKFDTKSTQVFTAKPIGEVDHLTLESYSPDGMTALYDAIAESMGQVEVALQREREDVSVLFIIFTDGDENSSKEFGGLNGLEKIRKMIKDREGKGNWTFVFFGTDIDAWSVGHNLGVNCANVMKVARGKTTDMYKALSSSTTNRAKDVACGGAVASADFFASNRSDYDNIDQEDQPTTDAMSGQLNNMRGVKKNR